MGERGRRAATERPADAGPVTRTHGEWVRSIVVAFAITFGATGALFAMVTVLINTTGGFLDAYVAIPDLSVGGAFIGAAVLGFLVATGWGWLGRPRVQRRGPARAGRDAPVARYWPGSDGAAPGGTGDPEVAP